MRTVVPLLLLCLASFLRAADSKPAPADFLALYTIVPDDAFNRGFSNAFEYQEAFPSRETPATVRGLYRGQPVLTMEQIESVATETREIQTAPISGLRFVLNDSGARLVREYLGQAKPKDLVAFVDGHAYATVSAELLREISEHRVLFLVLPDPQGPTSAHFLRLLADKLRTAVPGK